MRILFIGDIVGRPGRSSVALWVPRLREEFALDFVVANAENSAGGLGATRETIAEILSVGVQAITLGNHTWRKKSLVKSIDRFSNVARPANYANGVPGKGSTLVRLDDGRLVGLVNVLGRVYMEPCACPFEAARVEIARLRETTSTVLVDVHAEATAEKVAMGWFLDGTCSAVLGTHTHVQTADERILPGGTAYITDVGMTGPMDSVIGVERDAIIQRFLTGMPTEFVTSRERPGLNGVVIETDDATGNALTIERVVRIDG